MATLVLTAVGSAIGGPVGGAIGAAIGQQVDRALFAPKGRDGPRLKELAVQTSSYGTAIPAIFGVMRVAGTVIWATDLIERRVKSGGGKGRPASVGYSYSVSLAVAVSSRSIMRIGRIWADGNLLRGVGGDLKGDTQFRYYHGHNDQPLDPLIASAETPGLCPAYRGLAYAVFEDLQLADFGNRIPSLTFEVFDRDGPVPLNTIFGAASKNAIFCSSGEALTGYALSGGDGRAAIAPLLDILPVMLRAKAGGLQLLDWWSAAGGMAHIIPAKSDGPQNFEPPTTYTEPAYSVPKALALRHYEPERDFQSGVQRSQRAGSGRTSGEIELPAALAATAAKRIVDLQLLQLQRTRDSWTAQVVLDENQLHCGDWIADQTGRIWQIVELEHNRGSTKITARGSIARDPSTASLASPGRNLAAPDLLAGQTRIIIIDLPVSGTTDPGKPQLAVFANGTMAGWRRAALSVQRGDQLVSIGPTAAPAIIGNALSVVPPHVPDLLDTGSILDIQLLHSFMDIEDEAGTVWLEGEFLQFGSAAALGGGRYRLSQLQRGCYGSEAFIASHATGDRFVLLRQDSAVLLDDTGLASGALLAVEALGLGDDIPVVETMTVRANAIAPLPPVHGKASMPGDGSIKLTWVRRSRIDFGWNDGVDQALVEDSENYMILLLAGDQQVGQWSSPVNELTVSASAIAELQLSVGTVLTFTVRQIGRHMLSLPLRVELNFNG